MTQEKIEKNERPHKQTSLLMGFVLQGSKEKQNTEGKVTSRAFFRFDILVILYRVTSNF